MHLDGEFRANGALLSNASTTLVLSQVFTGGLAVWPLRHRDAEWKLELDVDYTDWRSFKNVDIHLSNGLTVPIPQRFRGSTTIMVGTEYRWLNMARLLE